ncbi:PREDICTED: uncharacterized protein LOC104585592 [Nelumbo nucifera]|uniref:Uncharacterized protein LOC104585592 n=1 Tax=Nelumbo nucifera TaxID=4432 RepID=A0A1U8QBA5_NELNU|nr:PREDICTED: uncharacterized protein LOC104585592 [Nelumbo nucifera]
MPLRVFCIEAARQSSIWLVLLRFEWIRRTKHLKNDNNEQVLLGVVGEHSMDKSWIYRSRTSMAYLEGLVQFLDFAFANANHEGEILCPCVNYNNIMLRTREEVYDHIVCD